MTDVRVLDVLLHGEAVGTLVNSGEHTYFSLNDAHAEDRDRPVVSAGFTDEFGGLITEFPDTRTRVMPFFSNMLPEGHLREYLAGRAKVSPVREFFLLRALGDDLPGAVTIRSATGEIRPSGDGDDVETRRHGENALRFSLAGVQLKFSAIMESAGGLTIPAEGVGGSWIVKLPSHRFPNLPENEFSMMTLARTIGMNVPEVKLVDTGEIENLPRGIGDPQGKALAVKRFDRSPDGAVHMEDFAQIFGVYPEKKYKTGNYRSIAKVIGTHCGETDAAEFIRRLTFNTLIGNADMHLKNWSLVYPDRRNAVLAPAYDLLSTIPYVPDREAGLKFSRTKRFDRFSVSELSHLASKAFLPRKLVLDAAGETVDLFHQKWRSEKTNLPLAANVVRAVEDHLRTIPIV